MSSTLTEPDRLFDRLWQPGHSFRPRCGPGRKWGMLALLAVLLVLIGAYWLATDPIRVRRIAESYLSDLLGGRVKVGGASLSIFEGLRLSRVSVTVPGPEAVDSTLFVVDSLDISYDPAALLRGKLDATRLIATGTHVFLVEDLGDGSWNYKRLKRSALKPRGKKSPSATEEPLILPEIVLRNASVEYSELRNGKYTSRGLLGLDGRLSPAGEQDQYLFELQSRGLSERVGPVLAGEVTLTTGRVSASLKNLSFGPDLLAMLPSEVRQLWQAHHLQGGLDIPVFNYTPATDKSKANFLLRTEFKDVRLVVRPQELGSHAVAERLDALERSIDQVRAAGFVFDPLADRLTTAAVPPDVAVQNVTGTFQFDPAGMSFDAVGGSFEGIPIVMSGKANGYAPDVPFHLHAQSPADRVIQLQPQLKYLSALPPVARKIYTMIQPSGYCTFGGDIDRLSAGAKPRVTGSLQILDGAARCIFFPYPVRHITGRLLLTADPVTGDQTLRLDRLRGVGPAESPNADTHVLVDGVVGPFDKRLGCDVNVTSDHVVSDPVLVAAFPPDVRDALSAFRSLPDGQTPPRPYPDFSGAFACHVTMPIAVGSKVTVALELHVADASGTVVAFPYPFRHAAGELHIRDGRLDVEHLGETAGNARVSFDGAVTWPTQLHPNVPAASVLVVHGRSIPIDPTLIGALPPDKAEAMKRLGIGGTLDIDGTINTDPPTAANAAAPAMDRLRFALDLGLHDAWLKTPDGRSEADRVNGIVHLTPDGASTKELHGRRGPAELSGTGSIDWTGAEPVVHMSVAAKGLLLDGPLRALLPVEAQSAWDAVTPSGAVDAEFAFDRKNAKPDYTLTLHPDHARVSPTFLPYAMTGCTGAITVTPDRTTLTDFEGDHGPARVKISGVGLNGPATAWDLTLNANNVNVDDELRRDLPAAVTGLLDDVALHGKVSIDLTKLNYRGTGDTFDADLAGTVKSQKATMDLGIPVDDVDGELAFDSAIRAGKLATLHGKLAVASLGMAGRSIQDLAADLTKPVGSPELQVDHLQGRLAGGEFAGQAALRFPDDGPTHYSLNFVLRNADVRDIARANADVQGLLSASVALEGNVGQPATRRGRGDVQVVGQHMYQIPLMLGLLQVTDLALPSSSPFSEATARYNVNGERINFDQIQMRSNAMLMSGAGYMDFGSKKVRMNFTTDNANLPQIPLLHELWQGAKQELLQIQVRGTIQAPKVGAASFHTFTTTVDEVFSGSDVEK